MPNVKHLLPPVPRYFKANLHTHSTITDGKFSPEELKALYKEKGYQILCISDHNVVVNHSPLNEEDFLLLTGGEFGISEPGQDALYKKSYHLNIIAKRPDNLWQPFWPKNIRETALPYLNLVENADIQRAYDTETINHIIAQCNEHGFLVVYNHPAWSLQDYTDYADLKGLWAMELCNYNCLYAGRDTYSTFVYRDLLAQGNRLVPIGADDMHTIKTHAGAWIMVGAEGLTYDSVIAALEKGNLYASTGPEIHSLTIDGNILKITCSDARSIALESDCRFAKHVYPVHVYGTMREASFDLTKWMEASQTTGRTEEAYIRLTVYGPYGHRAYTRAYYLTELL